MPQSPTPEELTNMRRRYSLTQRRAARLVCSSVRSWQYWERGEHQMHPAIWRYAKFAARWREQHLAKAKAKHASTLADSEAQC